MSQTIEVESIRRLDIKPGETLVVGLPSGTTAEQGREIKAVFKGELPEDVALILTCPTLDLTVLSPDQCPSSPA